MAERWERWALLQLPRRCPRGQCRARQINEKLFVEMISIDSPWWRVHQRTFSVKSNEWMGDVRHGELTFQLREDHSGVADGGRDDGGKEGRDNGIEFMFL